MNWSCATKMGKPVNEIHERVPDYPEKMAKSMNRSTDTTSYFSKLPNSRPIQRGSWGFELGETYCKLPGLDTPAGRPAGESTHDTSTAPSTSPSTSTSTSTDPAPDLPDISTINLRTDWQTLRRLPVSRAILFNFRAYFTPVTELRDEAKIPALAAKMLRDLNPGIAKYKGKYGGAGGRDWKEEVLIPKLEEWAEEQVEKGMVERDWEVGTLEESPFFPGWERKWRAQMDAR
ncbi:hypothetical protein MRB53_041627 [Persea americana]|nr:hypothetical protein MRB53_041627 [Persea americana]